MTALLEARGVSSGYGKMPVIRDVNMTVREGCLTALLGANGAGKTTTLLTLGGEIAPSSGSITWCGEPAPDRLWRFARHGLALVTEERSVFMGLTVRENLRVARCDSDMALSLFPELKSRMDVRAGLLSGGEQQMLALGRVLARRPKMLMVDELSLGLAPLVVRRLLAAVRAAVDEGVGVLLVEQHPRLALRYADHAYVMHRGLVTHSASAAETLADIDEIERTFISAPATAADRD